MASNATEDGDHQLAVGLSHSHTSQNDSQDHSLTVVRVGCGSSHSCAVLDNGVVLTWGRGEDGQLGHGDANERREPTAVWTLLDQGVSSVCCGAEYCVAFSPGQRQTYSWGWGDFGRLGHNDVLDVFIPKSISALAGKQVMLVSCGDTHSCALTDEGSVYTFGRNQNGQLGLGTDSDVLTPTHVTTLQGKRIVSVSAGAEHTLAATEGGDAFSWGWGRYGNLGDGHTCDRWVPTRVHIPDEARIVHVASGWRHSMCVDSNGLVFSFGWSKYGQLGHGDTRDKVLPQPVEALREHKICLISGGWRHTIAADDTGQLLGWGWNRFGQLGTGSTEDASIPTLIAPIANGAFRELACGWRHSMAVTLQGEVFAWGRGVSGQLGHGDCADAYTPRLLLSLSPGTMDRAALCTAEKPSTSFVTASDRYGVVPEDPDATAGAGSVPLVPQMKRARV